jgi:hypothetical protein
VLPPPLERSVRAVVTLRPDRRTWVAVGVDGPDARCQVIAMVATPRGDTPDVVAQVDDWVAGAVGSAPSSEGAGPGPVGRTVLAVWRLPGALAADGGPGRGAEVEVLGRGPGAAREPACLVVEAPSGAGRELRGELTAALRRQPAPGAGGPDDDWVICDDLGVALRGDLGRV